MAGSRPRGCPPRGFTWAAITALFLLMTMGNIVSATGSGLGCPDWPLCHGRLLPPVETQVLIEFSHRLKAIPFTLLLLVTVVLTWRRTTARAPRRLSLVLVALLAAQIGLGGVTVLFKLPGLVSTAHLVNALLILAGLIILAEGTPAHAPVPARLTRLAMTGLAALFLQLALGGYVRHAGAGLACPDFPLCSGSFLPHHWESAVHWIHRWLGVTLLGLFIHLALTARRTALARPAAAAAALAVLQVALGIAAVLGGLAVPLRAAHAIVAYVLWGVLVWLSVHAEGWGAVARSAEAPPREILGGVARAS
jgi:heme A synthase